MTGTDDRGNRGDRLEAQGLAMPVDRQAIEAVLAAKGAKKTHLARALGLPPPAVSQILAGKRRLTSSEIPKMAQFLGISLDEVLLLMGVDVPEDKKRLAIQGYVQGDAIVLRQSGDSAPLEAVESPLPGYTGTVVRVRGNEMSPRYRDGDILAFRPNAASPDSLLGRDAIVETEDGQLLLKVIQPGSEPGRYVLLSNNPAIPPLVNVRIKSVAPIDWHQP